ncbi:MAG: lipid A deacylase LpxR family protein [Acetobacteraceae bacterium]|nr:lipid A deacylase LpxR family protein [Acetobacteraceae bacterium]
MTTRLLAAATLAALTALSAGRAFAEVPVDPDPIWTLQIENDALNGTDRYYSSGIRLGWTSPTDQNVPDAVSRLGRFLFQDGRQRVSIDLAQTFFTPYNTQDNPPDPRDRPYAGVLLLNTALIQDTETTRSVFGASFGLVGPGAGGEEIQNGFHDLIGDTRAQGWGYQIHNQPLIQFLAERTWRFPLGELGGVEFDTLPSATGSVGLYRDYAQLGLQFRLGQGLQSDFGPARIRPGLSGSDAYTQTEPFVWYLFAGADGQAVGYDVTLNGNLFSSSRHVAPQPWQAEFQGGVAMMAWGWRLSFTHVIRTQEFFHQRGGYFNFDSLAVSAKF